MKICPLCQKQYEGEQTGFCEVDGQPLVESANEIAPPPPSAAQPVGAPFSASLAMTFFAHRFIENVPREAGTWPLCQPNVGVSSWQLVTELPVIAFWYLHENNFIRFAPAFKQGLYKNNVTIIIEADPSSRANFPGLEYDFWEIIKRSPRVTVQAVFRQFLGGRDPHPEDNLIKRLIQWMIQLAYGQPDTSPKPFIRLRDDIQPFETFMPHCRRMAIHEQAAQNIHHHWMKFRVEQPDIYYCLFDDVVNGALDRIGNNSRRHASEYFRAESIRRNGK